MSLGSSELIDQLQQQQGPDPQQVMAGFAGGGADLPTMLAQAFAALNAPREATQGLLAGGLNALGLGNQGGRAGLMDLVKSPVGRAALSPQVGIPGLLRGQLGVPTSPGVGALERTADMANEFTTDMLTDPLSFVGLGLPGKAAQAARLPAGFVRAVETVDALPDRAIRGMLRGLLQGGPAVVRGAAERIPTRLNVKREVLGADGNPTGAIDTRRADNLADYLWGGPSRRALHGRFLNDVQDIVTHLRGQGNQLELDAADFDQVGRRGFSKDTEALAAFHKLEGDFGDLLNRAAADPAMNMLGGALNSEYRGILARSKANAAARPFLDRANDAVDTVEAATDVMRDYVNRFEAGESIPLTADLMDEVRRKFNLRHEQLQYMSAGEAGILAQLPERLKGRGRSLVRDFRSQTRNAIAGRDRFVTALQEAWDTNPTTKVQPFPDLASRTVEERMQKINGVLTQLGAQPATNAREVITALAGRVAQSTQHQLVNEVKSWKGGDLLTSDLYTLVADRIGRDFEVTLDLTSGPIAWLANTPVGKGFDMLTTYWKQDVLSSLSYPLTNATSGVLMSALKNVGPEDLFRGFRRNFATQLAGKGPGEIVTSANAVRDALGIKGREAGIVSGPAYLAETQAVSDIANETKPIFERMGPLPIVGINAGLGGYAGYANAEPGEGYQGALIGTAAGAAGGVTQYNVSKFLLQRLALGTEIVLRDSAYAVGTTRHIQQNARQLETIVNDAFRTRPNPQNQAAILNDLAQRRAMVSQNDVETMLQNAGVEGKVARHAGKRWGEVIEDAAQEGVGLSNLINFDYKNLNNLEQFVTRVFPFSTWALKAFPFYAREVMERPLVGLALVQLARQQQQAPTEGGGIKRTTGSIENPVMSTLLSTVLGHDVTAYTNPLRGLVPFSDTMRNAQSREDETPMQTARRVVSLFGPGPHPLLEFALRVTGSYGPEEAPKGYSRIAGVVQGATSLAGVNKGRGVDMNQAFMDLERNLRPGQDPTDINQTMINRRIDELATKTGTSISSGDPRVSEHVRAKVERRGPIYDEAARQVAQQRGLTSTLGYGSQFIAPSTVVSSEEAAITKARAEGQRIPRELSQAVRVLAQKNPQAKVPAAAVRDINAAVEAIAGENGVAVPAEWQQIVADPAKHTAVTLNQWVGYVQEAEAHQRPLIRGYTGQGSNTEQELSSLLNLYASPTGVLSTDPQYRNLEPGIKAALDQIAKNNRDRPSWIKAAPTEAPTLQAISKLRTALREQYPLLNQYLLYKQTAPQGTPQDFLDNVWPNVRSTRN